MSEEQKKNDPKKSKQGGGFSGMAVKGKNPFLSGGIGGGGKGNKKGNTKGAGPNPGTMKRGSQRGS